MANKIKPEQVPNAVVDALWEVTGDHPVGVLASRYEAKLYLAAALSAWPGMRVSMLFPPYELHVVLPLTQTQEDGDA